MEDIPMKKIIATILLAVICLSFVACGGTDKQPAIDAFNATSQNFNELATAINADIEAYDEEVITTLTDMANLLAQYQEILSGDQEISQENLDEMIAWFADVDEWIDAVKAELSVK
jgi:hypothetical protein